MIFPIDNSKPINQNRSRFSVPVKTSFLPCSERPFCAHQSASSFISKNNKIYSKNNIRITQTTIKQNYPDYLLFGIENTTQNIYSADPLKLKVGVY